MRCRCFIAVIMSLLVLFGYAQPVAMLTALFPRVVMATVVGLDGF